MISHFKFRDRACPYIDGNDHRCAHHFSLCRMTEAFSLCLDQYQSCPTYCELQGEHRLATTSLTIAGRPLRVAARVHAAAS